VPAPVELPVTYHAGRLKMLGLLCISLMFVALGYWMWVADPKMRIIAGVTMGLFGLGVLVALISFHPRASFLTLSASGFEFASLFRRHHFAWTDIDVFVPIVISGSKMVGWNFADCYSKSQTLRGVSTALSGVEGALPDTYGYSHVELSRLMNELRAKHGNGA
jgi:membrane associated rhomboid family serine protease